jgi:curved DNA-binding protein CbpA
MDTDRDLYQILQIDPAAEQEVVQAAFKRLALKYHPDRNASPDAHSRMQALNDAYAIIGDPSRRAAYDCERRDRLQAQRQAEEQTRQQAERRAEAVRQRNEQMAAQRRAENDRQEQARVAAAQRRIEYEEQIRAQQAAQRRAKRERQQREWEAQQTAAEPVAPAEPIETSPEANLEVVTETQVWIEAEPGPIDVPVLSECERRKLALQQAQQALQNEIFKLDYGITDAVDQVNYWSDQRFPLRIEVIAGQDMPFTIGVAITVVALLLTGFMLTLGGAMGWAAAFGLVGLGTGWWTWRTSLSIVPVAHLVGTWTEIKCERELRRQHLTEELAQLEAVMRVSATRSE